MSTARERRFGNLRTAGMIWRSSKCQRPSAVLPSPCSTWPMSSRRLHIQAEPNPALVCAAHPFLHFVWLDLKLSRADRFEVPDWIRANPTTRFLPVTGLVVQSLECHLGEPHKFAVAGGLGPGDQSAADYCRWTEPGDLASRQRSQLLPAAGNDAVRDSSALVGLGSGRRDRLAPSGACRSGAGLTEA